jgi:hypothetical protein
VPVYMHLLKIFFNDIFHWKRNNPGIEKTTLNTDGAVKNIVQGLTGIIKMTTKQAKVQFSG